MTTDQKIRAALRAAHEFQQAIEFDCVGENGTGGNGGLVSIATLKKGDLLRIALLRVDSEMLKE